MHLLVVAQPMPAPPKLKVFAGHVSHVVPHAPNADHIDPVCIAPVPGVHCCLAAPVHAVGEFEPGGDVLFEGQGMHLLVVPQGAPGGPALLKVFSGHVSHVVPHVYGADAPERKAPVPEEHVSLEPLSALGKTHAATLFEPEGDILPGGQGRHLLFVNEI